VKAKSIVLLLCARVRAREKPKMRAALHGERRQPQYIYSVLSFLSNFYFYARGVEDCISVPMTRLNPLEHSFIQLK
jgi:hypothetical protein